MKFTLDYRVRKIHSTNKRQPVKTFTPSERAELAESMGITAVPATPIERAAEKLGVSTDVLEKKLRKLKGA